MSNMFKNIISDINNNKDYCYLDNIENNVIDIDKIFKDSSKLYKYKVYIKTNDNEYRTNLIGKTKDYLITINDDNIMIKDIICIEII